MKRLVFVTLLLNAAYAQVGIRSFYDGNGQLFRVLDSTGNLVEYDYDAVGNPTQIRRSVVSTGALSILNIVPQLGNANATVTIYGQNFSAVAAGNTVMFNGAAATVISATSGTLVVQVPNGATTGPVSVTVNGNTVTSGTLIFTVPGLLTITSISPASGYNGQTVTVNVQGANLTNASFALLGSGGIGVSNVNVASSTQVSFTATIGQAGGDFVLVGRNDFGASSSVPSGANTFHVYLPPGDNYTQAALSVFNTYIPPGTQPGVPAGSNAAFQMFSADNTATGVQAVPAISISPSLRTAVLPSATGTTPNASALVVGQTVEIDIASLAGFLPGMQFRVNGAVLASSATGSLQTYFTVPNGVGSLTLQATGQTAFGEPVESAPSQISVVRDRGLTIAGRVVDDAGMPVPGARVAWQANGLAVEYFQFNRQLSDVPDLTGLQPTRSGYVSALNYPNPGQVFGQDPLGAGLGQNYAVRFHGKLSVAKAGDYQFQWNARTGAQLTIDGVTATGTSGSPTLFALTAGVHDIEAVYYQSGSDSDGPAAQLLWTPPGGGQGVVPPEALSIVVGATAITGSDGHFRVSVPAALEGVRLSVASGQGSVVLDQ